MLIRKGIRTHVHCSITSDSRDVESASTPLIDEEIKKMWFIHTMEKYFAIKKYSFSIETTWLNLQCIMLHEINQTEKTK